VIQDSAKKLKARGLKMGFGDSRFPSKLEFGKLKFGKMH